MAITKDNLIICLQYFGFYYISAGIGGSLLSINSAQYGIGTIIYLIVVLVITHETVIPKWYFTLCVTLAFSLIATVLYTGGALSINSAGSMISHYILLLAVVIIDPDKFVERLLKFAFFSTCYSLVFYALSLIIGFGTMSSFALTVDSGDIRHFIFYNIAPIHYGKNIGMFGEPGQYQIFLCVALYLCNFSRFKPDDKKRTLYSAVFILGMLTALSTAGYIALIGFAVFVLPDSNLSPRVRQVLLAIIVIFVVYVIFILDENSLLYYTLFGKLTVEDGTVVGLGSGSARTTGISDTLNYIVSNPSCIFGIGYEKFETLDIDGIASLITTLLTFGIFTWLIVYSTMAWGLWKNRVSMKSFLLAIYIILVAGLSQPNLLNEYLVIMSIADILAISCGAEVPREPKYLKLEASVSKD